MSARYGRELSLIHIFKFPGACPGFPDFKTSLTKFFLEFGKVNKAEIKEAMDGVLKEMQGFDFTKFKEELGTRGFKVREASASTGKLNGSYVTARSGTEYKASEIGKGYTLSLIHISLSPISSGHKAN